MKEKREVVQYATSARRVKQILYELGWNQSRLAKEIGVSAQAVQLWAKGSSRPNGPNLTRLSEVTGKPEAWFFTDVDEPVLPGGHDALPMSGSGMEFLPLSEEEVRLLTVFRKYPPGEARNMLLAFEMRYKQLYDFYVTYASHPKK